MVSVRARDLTFFEEEGIDFPERVVGTFTAEDATPGKITFPKHVERMCYVSINEYFPAEGFDFSEYVGGDFIIRASGAIENNTFPRHVEGDFRLEGGKEVTSFRNNVYPEYIGGDCNLYGLTTAEHFECPQHIGGKLILSHTLKNDKHLDIPDGVEVYWL